MLKNKLILNFLLNFGLFALNGRLTAEHESGGVGLPTEIVIHYSSKATLKELDKLIGDGLVKGDIDRYLHHDQERQSVCFEIRDVTISKLEHYQDELKKLKQIYPEILIQTSPCREESNLVLERI